MKFLYWFDPTKERQFIRHGRLFVALGFGFAILNLVLMPILGINFGIDFSGGTEMQMRFAQAVKAEDIRAILDREGFSKNQVQQYGDEADNEWLVRIERIATLTDEKVQEVEAKLQAAFGPSVKVNFTAQEGDRFTVTVPDPTTEETDTLARIQALNELQARVATIIEQDAGLRLRRTLGPDNVESTADAIVRDEPYQGEVKFLVQLQGVSDKVTKALAAELGQAETRRVDFVDATVAEALKTDGFLAMVIALLLIAGYVAIRFDVFFAPGALIALIHDPIGALCIYTIGRMEFDLPSVAAILTILGYSIDHTIVIYDRVRETTPATPVSHEELKVIVNKAVNDTVNRTVNAVVTTLCASGALWIFTDGPVRTFAACLSIGILIGAYSSLFMAPTIYLFFRKTFYHPAAAAAPTGVTREDRERGIV